MPHIFPDEIIMDLPEPSPDPWLIVGIVAGVVAIAAVLTVVLVKRKKKGN